MSTGASSSIAVVTGATGYIAGHIVAQLLEKGYTVRGTVRSLSDPKSLALQRDFPSLQLYEADLLKAGSFDSAIDGARYVFHVSSPNPDPSKVTDGQREVIDPAVHGTETVVTAALNSPSVERLVITSSSATLLSPLTLAGSLVADTDWTDFWTVDNNPYGASKVQAERKAWQMVDAHNAQPNQTHPVRLVTILPSIVFGPPVGSRTDTHTLGWILHLLDGSQLATGYSPVRAQTVDVRDVAAAHIAAAEREEANGRYIVTHTEVTSAADYIRVLRKMFPTKPMPDKPYGQWLFPEVRADISRTTTDLNLELMSEEKSIIDTAQKLVELGVVQKY